MPLPKPLGITISELFSNAGVCAVRGRAGVGEQVARVSKELLNFTDTYVIDVPRAENVLYVLMTVLAVDAANCSKN